MGLEIKANIAGQGLAQIEVERGRISSVRLLGSADPAPMTGTMPAAANSDEKR